MITIKNIAARALLISVGAVFYSNSAWALLPIQHWTEGNGAKVYLVESPVIPMVDVQIDFAAGSRRAPAGQSGLASAVAAMASKGVKAGRDTSTEPALDENGLGEAWADLGANFEVAADNDRLQYSLRSLTDPPLLDKAARLAARQIGEPSFPADVWPRDRARWSASIKESLTRPATVANMQALHPQPIGACRAKVSIVGAVSRTQAQALVATLLSRLPVSTGCAPLPPVGEIAALAAPTEAELRAAKDNLIGGFALRIDSNKKLLGNVANIAWNELPLDYLDQWTKKVEALTVADVRTAMAKKLQPERMVTVVVGGKP